MELNSKQKMRAYDVLIGEALAEERKQKGLSLQDAADKVERSKQTVYNYERGIRSLNAADFLVYCDTLGFDGMKILAKTQSISDSELCKAYEKYMSEMAKEK